MISLIDEIQHITEPDFWPASNIVDKYIYAIDII